MVNGGGGEPADANSFPLFAGGTGANKRKPWDLKGKVNDMEVRMRSYQTKVKSAHEENEVLKGTMAKSQTRASEMERELELQRDQIRYSGVNGPCPTKLLPLSAEDKRVSLCA